MVKKELQKSNKSKFVLTTILLIIITYICCMVSVKAVDDDEASDYSFYTLSSNMSMALSTIAADTQNANAVVNMFSGLYPSAAGGVLGYPDKTSSRGVSGLFGSYNVHLLVTYTLK